MGPRGSRACALIVVGALGLGACIEPDLVACGDTSCPAGDVCTAGGCALPADVAACDGLVDGAACRSAVGNGTCVGGSCQSGLCGNGVLDPGEVCDGVAGVTVATGETCSADCQRIQVCGNGIVDPGEQCDDGNTNPADGCDACTLTTWAASALIGGNFDATQVGLSQPSAVAVDRFGNVFISELQSGRVRRLDVTGAITTLAGTGVPGYNGDGIVASGAQLFQPRGLAVDGIGNVYIADSINCRVRRVDPDGIITTVAGNGTQGYFGDGGPATSAELNFPYGVAIDGLGNLFIADSNNGRIRRVDTSGIITTVASGAFSAPADVAVDSAHDLYVADTNNHRIARITPDGTTTTVAGSTTGGFSGDGGPATSAELSNPTAIALDSAGNLYIADHDNARIRLVDTSGMISTVAGGGSGSDGGLATAAQLVTPMGVAAGAGTVLIADSDAGRVREVAHTGIITTIAGIGAFGFVGDGGGATSATLVDPCDVAIDAAGNIYIADTEGSRIRRVDTTGVITTIAGTGDAGSSGDGGPATAAELNQPYGVAVDATGNIYIADTYNQRIRRIDTAGVITTIAGIGTPGYSGDGAAATAAQLAYPYAVTVDGQGVVYISDSYTSVIRRIDTMGIITTIAGTGTQAYGGDSGPALQAQLDYPMGLAVDATGDVYFADSNNNRVRKVDTNGVITTVAGNGVFGSGGDTGSATQAQLGGPNGLAIDAAGNLYIGDTYSNRIRRVDTGGVITTLAGTGNYAFSGDGGTATSAQLAYPRGLRVDALGNVYAADYANNAVRRVSAAGIITTVAGAIDPTGVGPVVQARLFDPRAVVIAPPIALIAGGNSGTVEATLGTGAPLAVVTGRYPHTPATGVLARFRDQNFGTVTGVAYDAGRGFIYLTESSANRLHVVTIVDPADPDTWTIAPLANAAGTPGFADGAAQTAEFRDPTGLFVDPIAQVLYVADTGNHVVRAIDLSGGAAAATVRTIVGTPETLGFFGDGGAATDALLYEPQAITRCANGDLFIADTRNNRVRRVAAGVISTVLGDGTAASSGEGMPASSFPVDAPLGLACDALGNLFATSTTTVRLVPADATGTVDGSGAVHTLYGATPRTTFPASVTSCLTGIAFVDATTMELVDSCTGLLVQLHRQPAM